jgi:protein-L-isoaspartate(D-aspartate) O-methyltransferase
MDLEKKKEQLISNLISCGILKTKSIIDAFRRVKREDFVTMQYKNYSYVDEPLPILEGQTISQPYTVAAMTEALQPEKGQRILEVGTGSGYQAAILAEIVGKSGKIVTTERLERLVDFASSNLRKAGYTNVVVVNCDGSRGYEKEAPYDRIIVTASSPDIPKPLIEQLKVSGILVIPVGDELLAIRKIDEKKIEKSFLGYYAFVPLIGKYGHHGQ